MNIASLLQETSTKQPNKIAYHFLGQDTSYEEFDALVSKFASALQDLGLEKGDHIAFLLGNTPHFLISLYATMRVGAIAIPVNPIYTLDEISYIVQNSDAKAIIALDQLLPCVEQDADAFSSVEHYIICESDPSTRDRIAALPVCTKSKVYLFTQAHRVG